MRKFIYSVLKLFCFCIFMCLFFSFFRGAEVHGTSMYPFLEEGDFFFILRTTNVSYGDVVSVYSGSLDRVICKRVIGVENDEIEIRDGKLYRNGEYIEEPYVRNTDNTNMSVIVGKGQVFLLGDNRPVSMDSRQLGCIGVENIIGKMLFNIGVKREVLTLIWAVMILAVIFLNTGVSVNGIRKFGSNIRGKGDKQSSSDRE